MVKSSNYEVRWLCLFLSILLASGFPSLGLAASGASSAAADLSYPDLVRLGQSEKILYGSTHKNLPGQERVQALEIELFGEQHKGSYHNRIDAIQSALASGKTNMLMPPMAPELDRGVSNSEPAAAPSSGADTSQAQWQSSELAADSGEDKTKALLHDALKLYSSGQYQQAELAFKKVIALDRNNTDAYFNLGAMAESRADYKTALSYYQSALKINPGDQELSNAVAGVRKKIDDNAVTTMVSAEMPKPAPTFTKAAESRGDLKQRINDASAAYKSGNYDQSIRILKSVAMDAPNEASVQYALSQCYKAKHQYMDARSALSVAVNLDPNNQLYKDALNDLDRRIANSGSPADGHASYDTVASDSSASAPVGQITPFTGVNASPGWQSTGTASGYSGSGGYLSGFGNRGGFGSYSTSGRIQRAAIGGMSGAAIGAMFGGGYRSRGRNAMIGGTIGGLFGLLSGH